MHIGNLSTAVSNLHDACKCLCINMSVEGAITEGCIMCMLDKALAAYLLCSPNICAADFREAEHVCALQEEHVSEAAGDCG